ncbi:MAG: hypothetical protein ACFFC0_07655 [Promethearchaeota archaeon]
MRVLRSFALRRKILTVFLAFVLLGCLFVPFAEQEANDGLESKEGQLNDSMDDVVNPNPMRNVVLSEQYKAVMFTNNSFDDVNPQIDAGHITWQGWDGSDNEIFLYDGSRVTQITDNSFDDRHPQIDAGQITWQGSDGSDYEIFLYDGISTTQLTDNSFDDLYPQIDAGLVTWEGQANVQVPIHGWEIFLYNGTSTTRLTDNEISDREPQIDAGQVTWHSYDRFDGSDYEVFLYDGISTTQLTDNWLDDEYPQIDAGQVTWVGWDGSDYEIFLYDGASTIQLTDNSLADWAPKIDAGLVTWEGSVITQSNEEIFLYDGTSTTQLTDNSFRDTTPEIDGGQVTWEMFDGLDTEIFFYDGASITQLTDNLLEDHESQIDAGQVTWQSRDKTSYPYSDWEIFLYLEAGPPDPPDNPYVHQRIQHNLLTWDKPVDDGGIYITHYNVYRGTTSGGIKTYLGSSLTTEYNDTEVVSNTLYYYNVAAVNLVGESGHSREVSGMPRDAPFLEWRSPDEGAEIIFPMGPAVFHFLYDWGGVDNVTLEINGTSFGSVWEQNSTLLDPYTADIDGAVEAVLKGYWDGSPVASDSLSLTLSKLTYEASELLETGEHYNGLQLYSIIHDPCGDKSYSSYEREWGWSIGVEAHVSITLGQTKEVVLPSPILPTIIGVGGSSRVEVKGSTKFDFRMETKHTAGISSSRDSSNPDYIGPGYGDTYWGEVWKTYWYLTAVYREYFNGTGGYEEPVVRYQIERSEEVYLSDLHVPEDWRASNPAHSSEWDGVNWLKDRSVAGGAEFHYTLEETNSSLFYLGFDVTLSEEASLKVVNPLHPLTEGARISFYFELSYGTYFDWEEYVTDAWSYRIGDDDPTDYIAQEIGVDIRFGTPIFRPIPIACKTSSPLEHNTFDYIPPVIEFPTIDYDSSFDGIAPCRDDVPKVTVDIFDEGVIRLALIWYSINGGTNWDSVNLTEQIANRGTWQASIPAMHHGTSVLWYIQAWDLQGSNSTRKDPHGRPFEYIVLNRAPSIEILSPNGAESFLDVIRITWSAFDIDGDALTYTPSYNIADTGWQLLASGISGNYFDWDISGIPYCETVLVKVVADDGFGGTASDESDYVFTIGEAPADGNGGGAPVEIVLIVGATAVGAVLAVGVFLSRRSRIIVE